MSFSFGVGCFSFRIVPEVVPVDLTVEEYGQRVVGALKRIPNVGNIDILGDDLDHGGLFHFDEPPENLNFGRGQFIYPTQFESVTFDLHIPHRVQEDLFSKIIPGFSFECESFAVAIHGGFYGPVTFVTLVDYDGGPQADLASAAVMLVREFFVQHLTEDSGMVLDSLGPSPFHADFVAIPADQEQITTVITSDSQRGYDLIEVLYPQDSEDPIDAIQSVLSEDFGLFYETMLKRNIQWRMWGEVQLRIEGLRSTAEAKGNNAWRRKFRLGALADKALLALAEHEAARVEMSLDSSRAWEEAQGSPPASRFILDAVKREVDRMADFPNQATEFLIRLYQQQYIRRLNVAVVLVASVVGGVVGGLIGLAL